jgi:hypothetical protein
MPAWSPNYTMDTWRAECGIGFSHNNYYTSAPAKTTVNCNCIEDPPGSNSCGQGKAFKAVQPSFAQWQTKHGNDKGSTLGGLPTDDELLGWAKEKLGM